MSELIVANHGGMCCGIKTIHGFGWSPSHMQPLLTKKNMHHADQFYHYTKQDENFFCEDAPAESTVDRLDRYLAWLKFVRPQHVIEVVLVDSDRDEPIYSQEVWFSVLEERGFVLKTEFKNSNSGNTCYIFHLVLDEPITEENEEHCA